MLEQATWFLAIWAFQQAGRLCYESFQATACAKRTHLLYHGTLLYDFDLPLIETCLRTPPRQPDYRGRRSHLDFVTNLPVLRQPLIEAVHSAWPTQAELKDLPDALVAELVKNRLGHESWNFEFR